MLQSLGRLSKKTAFATLLDVCNQFSKTAARPHLICNLRKAERCGATLTRASQVSKPAGLSLQFVCPPPAMGLRPFPAALGLRPCWTKQFHWSGAGRCSLPWCLACWASHPWTFLARFRNSLGLLTRKTEVKHRLAQCVQLRSTRYSSLAAALAAKGLPLALTAAGDLSFSSAQKGLGSDQLGAGR